MHLGKAPNGMCYIYTIRERGRVVYVGRTINFKTRRNRHAVCKKSEIGKFIQLCNATNRRLTMEHECTVALKDGSAAERAAVEKYAGPRLLNLQYNEKGRTDLRWRKYLQRKARASQ